jgi:drug/metabolite transporter (DMT)-like permease
MTSAVGKVDDGDYEAVLTPSSSHAPTTTSKAGLGTEKLSAKQDAESAIASVPSDANAESKKWIGLCIFAGLLNGLWSPLSTLGTTGEGAVTSAFVSLLLFQIGQSTAIPVFLNYYGYPNLLAPHYIHQLVMLPFWDIIFGLACGVAVGTGFTFYFVASKVVSSAIAFAIGACCPIFTILLGVLFAKQLSGASLGKKFLLLGSVSCYVIAIALIASSK